MAMVAPSSGSWNCSSSVDCVALIRLSCCFSQPVAQKSITAPSKSARGVFHFIRFSSY